jgi:sterol desaturase/sphingolipid hydroxylase (fatty acid hydroxylase superfamily)
MESACGMKLSPIVYYSDFIVYPILISILAGIALLDTTGKAAAWWVAAFAISVAAWTLLEYALHRVVFHHFPVVREMHTEHHVHETASTGTPLWLSLVAFAALAFLPLWLLAGFPLASATSAGLMSGYLWYVSTHHALHHWHPGHGSYLYRLKRRHALHHHVDGNNNFGVTTGVWDRVFYTSDIRS